MGDTAQPFCRVLDPVDPWVEPASDEERAANFHGRSESTSVASLVSCTTGLVMAGFYGPSRYQIPLNPHCFRFTDEEVRRAGGDLHQTPSDPPWPPEYSEAHHDLTGDQVAVASAMVQHFNADQSRAEPVSRIVILGQICALLARADIHRRFGRNGWRRIRKLLELPKERVELWAPLASDHPHLLDDSVTQQRLRRLYNVDRTAWERVAARVPRVGEDPDFGQGGRR
jgi:hypothetical protein